MLCTMKPEDILSTRETCQALGITHPTLFKWMKLGKITPWGKLGGNSALFFLKTEVAKAKGKRYKRV